MSYENLEAACGGSINPDTLRKVQLNMLDQNDAVRREFHEFMYDDYLMMGPAGMNTWDKVAHFNRYVSTKVGDLRIAGSDDMKFQIQQDLQARLDRLTLTVNA
jgi:hypothetical protein